MDWASIGIQILLVAVSALIGIFLGRVKAFREQKQRVYGEILPPIAKMAYDPKPGDEQEFNRALMKLWLYANASVTRKIDHAVSLIHHPERGNVTQALQEAIAGMRVAIQVFPWPRVKPEDVKHLYTRILEQRA